MDTFDMFDAFEPYQQTQNGFENQNNQQQYKNNYPERQNYHQNPYQDTKNIRNQTNSNENQAFDMYTDLEDDYQQNKIQPKKYSKKHKKQEEFLDPQQGYRDSDLLIGENFQQNQDYDSSDPQRNYLINQEQYYKKNNFRNNNNDLKQNKSLRQLDSQPYRQNIIERNLKYSKKNYPQKKLEQKAKQDYKRQLDKKNIPSNTLNTNKTGIFDMLDYSQEFSNTVQIDNNPNYSGIDVLKQQLNETHKSLNYSYYSQQPKQSQTQKIKRVDNKPYRKKQSNLKRSISQNSDMDRSAYISTAYNEEELMEKMELGKKKFGNQHNVKRREIPQVRKSSINSEGGVDLIGQKYLISAYIQLSKEYKQLGNKYVSFRRECLNSLERRDQGGMIGYQDFSSKISYLSQDLLQIIQQGIPAPYPQRIKRCIKQLDNFQKEMGWFLLVQEAQQYFSVEFYQTIMTYESQKSLDVLLDLLDKNNIKYQGLLDQMVFEYKQGYTLYNTMSLLVESIKIWLKIYFYYKSFIDIFNVYLTYSKFKKIIKSNQVHENFIKIEYQFQQILSNRELPSYYCMSAQTSLVELKAIKQQYYQYYVEYKTEKKYTVGKEMYDMVKEMKKYLNNYNQNYENENKRRELRNISEQIIRDSNQIYKKVNILVKKNQSDQTLDRLLNKFLHKYEIIENTLVTLRPNTKLGPKEFTHY